MIIGFGKTEEENEIKEMNIWAGLIKEVESKWTKGYFDREYVELITQKLYERVKQVHEEYEENGYKSKNEAPERYYDCSFCLITHDVINIYIEVRFMHINRRHALSKDGWAGLNRRDLVFNISREPLTTDELLFKFYPNFKEIKGE